MSQSHSQSSIQSSQFIHNDGSAKNGHYISAATVKFEMIKVQGRITLFLLVLVRASSFASWLRCYIDLDDSEIIMNYQVLLPEDAPHLVHIEVSADGETWTDSFSFPAEAKTSIRARLRVPEELIRRDVQYVIESTNGGTFHDPAMCDGVRSHASAHDESVGLVIDGSVSERIELWAAWASGHEAVSLTPRLLLRRDDLIATEAIEL